MSIADVRMSEYVSVRGTASGTAYQPCSTLNAAPGLLGQPLMILPVGVDYDQNYSILKQTKTLNQSEIYH